MKHGIAQKRLWIVILVIACIFVLFPVFRQGLLVTDDQDWMVIRLSAFYQSLRDGQFPVRVLGRLNNSYGYPVSNFQYPGLFYVGSFLHGLGLSFPSSIEAIIVLFTVGGSLALFSWLRYFFDVRASALGTLSYLFMPYLLYDIYTRGSIGEIVAINTCLVVFYAIESKRSWLFVPSIAFLAISHNTLALFFIPAILAYVIFKKYWNLISLFVIGVGMSSFFWLPALFERHLVIFDSVSVSDPTAYFPVSRYLVFRSLPLLFSAILLWIAYRKDTLIRKEFPYFAGLFFLGIFFGTSLSFSFWTYPSFSKYVQFPFRFFSFWCISGPWFVAAIAGSKKISFHSLISLCIVLSLFFLSLSYQKSQSIVRSESFYTTNESTTTVANEFMPRWVNTIPSQRNK